MPPRLGADTTTYGVSVSDWNSAQQSGWYQGPPGTVNGPQAGAWGIGFVIAHRSDASPRYITQEVWDFTGPPSVTHYRRHCQGDVWSGWVAVGAGGGGDTGWLDWPYYPANVGAMGAPWGPPQYRKIGNEVILRGLVQTIYALETPSLTILPAGYRPVGLDHMNLCVSSWSGGPRRVDVQGDGTVVMQGTTSDGEWINMGDIRFMAN
jgi:hypothetical protein